MLLGREGGVQVPAQGGAAAAPGPGAPGLALAREVQDARPRELLGRPVRRPGDQALEAVLQPGAVDVPRLVQGIVPPPVIELQAEEKLVTVSTELRGPLLQRLRDGLGPPSPQIEQEHARLQLRQGLVGHVRAEPRGVRAQGVQEEAHRGPLAHARERMVHGHPVQRAEVGPDDGVRVEVEDPVHTREQIGQVELEELGLRVREPRNLGGVEADGLGPQRVHLHGRGGGARPKLPQETGPEAPRPGRVLPGHEEVHAAVPRSLQAAAQGEQGAEEAGEGTHVGRVRHVDDAEAGLPLLQRRRRLPHGDRRGRPKQQGIDKAKPTPMGHGTGLRRME
mmetsp:Transcript_40367/g.125607  ORF Transcript_40367/g.125607 Transcript_40367/m.125607 type:complete len:336 (+) Transcript_40367:372-1379(+)